MKRKVANLRTRYLETDPVTDTKRLLDTEPKQLGELFNRVFADPLAYPLVLAGGNLLRVPSIVLLLLLLLLDVPGEHIDQDLTSAFEKIAAAPPPWDIEKEDWERFLATRKEWAEAIREHVEKEYNGIVTYLRKVGVSPKSMAAIKETLSAKVEEKNLIDVSS